MAARPVRCGVTAWTKRDRAILERVGCATEILVAEEPNLAQQAHGLGWVGGGNRFLHRPGQVAALRLPRWTLAGELEPD